METVSLVFLAASPGDTGMVNQPLAELVGSIADASLPSPGGYISIAKLVFVLVWFGLWVYFCQWVDKDTQYVKSMSRYTWNGIVLGSGLAGLAIWLLLPWQGVGLFVAGWGVWLIVTAGACAVYVVLRNRVVAPPARVFTPRHLAEQLRKIGGKKAQTAEAFERVSVTMANGKKLKPPEDPAQIQPYETVQNLLFDALWRRANQVALAAVGENVRLVYKIDGVNTERRDLLTAAQVPGAIDLLKQIANLNIEERRKPQSGKIHAVNPTAGTKVEMEVRTSGTKAGEQVELRIMTQEARLRMPDLGLNEQQLEQLDKIVKAPKGLVIISGPRGSGVTTTLYACLRAHDAFMQNLQSLERTPLMELENITQNRFDPTRADVPYARQLQSIFRREPDVVMVSDCPDQETAHLAAKSATEGKKVYLGMQARNTLDALNRFKVLCTDSELTSQALLGICCQRLIRKLCVSCREPYKPDAALLRKANIPADHVEYFYRARTEPMLDKKGKPVLCPNCQGSGHFGRVGVFEVLVLDDAIRELIRNGQPAAAILKQARKNGMRELQEVGIQLVVKGITSMNEVIRGLRDEDSPQNGPEASAGRP